MLVGPKNAPDPCTGRGLQLQNALRERVAKPETAGAMRLHLKARLVLIKCEVVPHETKGLRLARVDRSKVDECGFEFFAVVRVKGLVE